MTYGRMIDCGLWAVAIFLGYLIISHDATNAILARWCLRVKGAVFSYEHDD